MNKTAPDLLDRIPNARASYAGLDVGARYRVVEQFADYDSHVHPVGEQFTYLGYHVVAYHEGLTIYVSLDTEECWGMRFYLGDSDSPGNHLPRLLERV